MGVDDMCWFKTCPRCKGDLFLERDAYEQSIACLQCGWRVYGGQQSQTQIINGIMEARNSPAGNYATTTTMNQELIPV